MMIDLSPQMRQALEANPGEPLEIIDPETQRVYVLVDREAAREMLDAWLLKELQIGFAAADRGELAEADYEAIKAAGRRRLPDSN